MPIRPLMDAQRLGSLQVQPPIVNLEHRGQRIIKVRRVAHGLWRKSRAVSVVHEAHHLHLQRPIWPDQPRTTPPPVTSSVTSPSSGSTGMASKIRAS